MKNRLPPLNALQVFEVAARKLSFSQAAKELFVTQGAVSKQIKRLESHLDVALFDRQGSGLRLTQAGKQFLPTVIEALDQIQSASSYLSQQTQSVERFTVDVTPSFSSLWLIPRLESLRATIPSLHLDISAGDGGYQFHSSSADIAVRCLPLSVGDDKAVLLRAERLLLVAGAKRLARSPIDCPDDLLSHPLLMHTTRPQLWRQCLDNWGVANSDLLHTSHGVEHFYMSLEAARQQLGLALVPDFLAEHAIASGELVNPLGLAYDSGFGFYFLAPSYRSDHKLVCQLRTWFKTQLAINGECASAKQ